MGYKFIPWSTAVAGGGTFTDNFTRSNSAIASSATSSSGGSWYTSRSAAVTDCTIVSNELKETTVPSGVVVNTPSITGDYSASMTLSSTVQLQGKGVCCRLQSSSNFSGYMAYVDSLTQVTIYKIVDTGTLAFTGLGAAYTVTSLVAGDVLTIQCTGSTFVLKINGATQGTSRTDSTYASGRPGLLFNASGSGAVTLFAVA